jgi:hypothetical protein
VIAGVEMTVMKDLEGQFAGGLSVLVPPSPFFLLLRPSPGLDGDFNHPLNVCHWHNHYGRGFS